MFHLDTAIAAWRQSLHYNRAFDAEDLDELERHLRDQVDALVEGGMTPEAAYRRAVRDLGSHAVVETEYRKVFWGKRRRRRELGTELIWRLYMLKNYLLVARRTLRRHPVYALINGVGLALGIAACLLIGLYIQDERTFDAFHDRSDRIFRIVESRTDPAQTDRQVAYTAGPVAPALAETYPEVEVATRLVSSWTMGRRAVTRGDVRFYVGDQLIADGNFFEVFGFPLLVGDPDAALREPLSVVLTEEAARRYFGDVHPLGATLDVEGFEPFTVTGVVADPPANSHLQFSMLFSAGSMMVFDGWRDWYTRWDSDGFATYVMLREGADPAALATRIADLVDARRDTGDMEARQLSLQALTAIHFGSGAIDEELNAGEGERAYLYVFGAVALLILLIACINYMNLATARSMLRAREVGLRKVVGARRTQLIGQFLAESVVLAALALVLGLALALVALPFFNTLAGKELRLLQGWLVPALALFTLLVGVLSGSYPAFHLSRFRPVVVLKGGTGPGGRGAARLRRGLVVAQFALSIVMIAASVVVYDQLTYVQEKRLGYDEAKIAVVDINSGTVRRDFATIKEAFSQVPAVERVTVSSRVPGEWKNIPEVEVTVAGARPRTAYFFAVDEDFLDTYRMALAAGRNFDPSRPADSMAVLVNETAARVLGVGPGDPLRIPAMLDGGDRNALEGGDFVVQVIGIVEDYHFQSLHERIAPAVLGYRINPIHAIDYFSLRLRSDDLAAAIPALQAVGERFDPGHPFEFNVLVDRLGAFYVNDRRVGRIVGIATMLAVLVACMGLFGLATFTAERRKKEIGVRKVLGASVAGVVALFAGEFARLVALALVVAVPIAYLVIESWLSGFAYRVSVGAETFVVAGALAAVITALTIAYQALRAAMADPVESLRCD